MLIDKKIEVNLVCFSHSLHGFPCFLRITTTLERLHRVLLKAGPRPKAHFTIHQKAKTS